MPITFASAISTFGADAKAKLTNPAATGEPEDQLRAPLEHLIKDLAEITGHRRSEVTLIGETSLSDLKTRPDYSVTIRNLLVGFIEVKAPGKGADPRRYRGHDKEQWKKLQSLPNLIYTDGEEFSLWRNGELVGSVIRVNGNIETSGSNLDAPLDLLGVVEDFVRWQPIPPRDAPQLAKICARLCRLLCDEVIEQLELRSPALTALAADWRHLLFPEATDAQFADGYAQAVTFGMLMARAREIRLSTGLEQAARLLGQTNSLIGAALRLLTDDADNQATLTTSMGTLTRVLDAVNWESISRGDSDAWLYFYENFLAIYDNDLRKQTGSYYTPPEVVGAMVRLVDDVLRSRFALHSGLAAPEVTLADPAVGTGTFLLGVLRRIAETIEADEGAGALPAAINSALARLIAFELQLGPFAVAQLRMLAEVTEITGAPSTTPLRMYVTDTLGNPYVEQEWLPATFAPIAESRRQANEIKRQERITVVIGNPPYKEKARGRGGWVESGSANSPVPAPLAAWIPPADWGVGAHAKHLRNLYVYFWRWATWKAFDNEPDSNSGIVCFITVAGFLNGPGFERMRDYLRRTADEIWVIDCSPEGHQPGVNTRIFQGVQQPVCIVLVSRAPETDNAIPATVRFQALPEGRRESKFEALTALSLRPENWVNCSSDWRAPFLPESVGDWATYPPLEDLFIYNGSGVMPGRTWIIAPDAQSLARRWQALIDAPPEQKEALFHPHLSGEGFGDRHTNRVVATGLAGHAAHLTTIANETDSIETPIKYGFRSFDRQWIVPDNRLINRPNPKLWELNSTQQVYITAPSDRSPTAGPALSFTDLIPDLHHYNGRGGRTFPLWRDAGAAVPNIHVIFLTYLSERYQRPVTAEDFFAYIAGIAANPSFTSRFRSDLVQPGLRIPITASEALFARAAELGRNVIWLHTFGERYIDPGSARPARPPRLPSAEAPRIPAAGAIPQDREFMPDTMEYDEANRRILIGDGYVDRVSPEVWNYEVSGKQVLRQWFSYRKRNRERPIIGDRRPPSRLGDIQPDHWLPEYTTELLNVINVIGLLVGLEPAQAEILEAICAGPTITVDELRAAGAFESAAAAQAPSPRRDEAQGDLLS